MNDTTRNREGGNLGGDLEARIERALLEREEAVDAVLRDEEVRDEDEAFLEGLREEWIEPAPALRPVAPPPERVRRRRIPQWVPLATAAAVLVGAFTLTMDRGGNGVSEPGTTLDDRYLGTDEAAGETLVFDGVVEWPVSFGVPPLYDVVLRDLDPTKLGDAAIIATYEAEEGPTWTCPEEVKDRLPERFAVELHDLAAGPGQVPQSLEFKRP